MATLKRQKADGTWEYVQVVGSDLISKIDELETHSNNELMHVSDLDRENWDSKVSHDHTHDISELNTSSMKMPKLLTYYGYPIGVNGYWSEDKASRYFAQYEYIIFGNGVQKPTHDEYASSLRIISKVKELNNKTILFGYIPLGVSTGNKSIAELKDDIDLWIVAGVHGIFVDEFGYDYLVSRERQNEIVNYIHSKNMPAFVNSWESIYVFKEDNVYLDWANFNGNPNNIPTVLGANDYAMIEGFVVNDLSGNEGTNGFVSKWAFEKYDQWAEYRRQFGTKIIGQNVIKDTLPDFDKKIDTTFAGAYLYSLDAIGIARSDFGATNSSLVTYDEPLLSMFGDYYDINQLVQHDSINDSFFAKHTRISKKGEITVVTDEVNNQYYATYPKYEDYILSKINPLLDYKQDLLTEEQTRKITISQAPPTGGSDGDIWFQYK